MSRRRVSFSTAGSNGSTKGRWAISYALVDSKNLKGETLSTSSSELKEDEQVTETFLWIPRVTYTNLNGADLKEEEFGFALMGQDPNYVQMDLFKKRRDALFASLDNLNSLLSEVCSNDILCSI
jgi:hypothetical protein